VEGIVPLTKQTKRQRKALIAKFKPGQKLTAVVMEVKPEEKKVILYMEELGKHTAGPKDEVQEYLASQEAPAAEKIEIPEHVPESESPEEAAE